MFSQRNTRLIVIAVLIVGGLAFTTVWAADYGQGVSLLATLPASMSVVTIGLAAVFVVGKMASANERKPYLKQFRTVAVRLDGWVRENLFGEFQLEVPHPLGGLSVCLRTERTRRISPNANGRWTRYCFLPEQTNVRALKLNVDAGVPLSQPQLNADAMRALTLMRDINLRGLRVRVRRATQLGGRGASIEVWLSGWPKDADSLSDQIHTVAPQLVALADALNQNY